MYVIVYVIDVFIVDACSHMPILRVVKRMMLISN